LVTGLPLFAGLDLDDISGFVLGGHDVRRSSLADSVAKLARRIGAFDPAVVAACVPDLEEWGENVRPGTVLNNGDTIAALADRTDLPRASTPRGVAERLQQDLREFRDRHRLDQVVVINVASTEPASESRPEHASLERLQSALARPDP